MKRALAALTLWRLGAQTRPIYDGRLHLPRAKPTAARDAMRCRISTETAQQKS